MPLTLNVGLSKKIGQPHYSSLGASCQLSVELDAGLLANDLEKFHTQVRTAFEACRQAIDDELALQTGGSAPTATAPDLQQSTTADTPSRMPRLVSPPADNPRRATAGQIRALQAIAGRHELDLPGLLQEWFQTTNAGDLSITEASNLIDELKSMTGQNGTAA